MPFLIIFCRNIKIILLTTHTNVRKQCCYSVRVTHCANMIIWSLDSLQAKPTLVAWNSCCLFFHHTVFDVPLPKYHISNNIHFNLYSHVKMNNDLQKIMKNIHYTSLWKTFLCFSTHSCVLMKFSLWHHLSVFFCSLQKRSEKLTHIIAFLLVIFLPTVHKPTLFSFR